MTTPTIRSGPERFWGQGIAALFPPDTAPTTVVPWPSAGRRKDRRDHDQDLVGQVLVAPPCLALVDPRTLWATQPGITRSGVDYYLNDLRYPRLGRTYADRDKVSNAFPFIYRRTDGQNLILAGHHRSAAALVRGEPVLALVGDGPWGGPRKATTR